MDHRVLRVKCKSYCRGDEPWIIRSEGNTRLGWSREAVAHELARRVVSIQRQRVRGGLKGRATSEVADD